MKKIKSLKNKEKEVLDIHILIKKNINLDVNWFILEKGV